MSKLSQTKIVVLDSFESRTDDWTFGDFEKALEAAMGKNYGNYQTAKMTIVEADKEGRWPMTVSKYVLSNYSAFGSSPVELSAICKRLLAEKAE
ncbi:MAG: hypothetical protein ACWA6Y_00825 [Polaromonas sp.]